MPKRRWEVLLTVTELTKQIEEGIEDRRVFRFKMLPFIALEGGRPWASNPPAGTRVTPFTETSYALAWAINRELLEASPDNSRGAGGRVSGAEGRAFRE